MLPALTFLVALGATGVWSLTRPAPRTLLLGGGVLAAAQMTGTLIVLGLLALPTSNCAPTGFEACQDQTPSMAEVEPRTMPNVRLYQNICALL